MAASQTEKLHAACDECRARKMKCSGESPQCSRCQKEGVECFYSPKKPMGRPRKRRRDETTSPMELQSLGSGTLEFAIPRTGTTPLGVTAPSEFTDFSNFGTLSIDPGMTLTPISLPQHDPPMTYLSNQKQPSQLDLGPDLPIDPLLWNTDAAAPPIAPLHDSPPNQPLGPCPCLSMMYLALTELQSMTSFTFPAANHTLRKAMDTASTIMHCKRCPSELSTSMQNTQSLSALLFSIAERFHKILKAIDAEAAELERKGEKKAFRFGDSNPLNQHLHTATPDCPMGFNVDLDGKDWKVLAKKIVKTEVLGSNPNSFTSLLDQFEKRQGDWHSDPETMDERKSIFGDQNCQRTHGEPTCIRMIGSVRGMVATMKWD